MVTLSCGGAAWTAPGCRRPGCPRRCGQTTARSPRPAGTTNPRTRARAIVSFHLAHTRWGVAARLGELEEELLQLLFGVAGLLSGLCVPGAQPQAAGEDLEPDLVQGAGGGRDLTDDVAALTARLDHADEPTDLALDAAQPSKDVVDHGFLQLHRNPLPKPLHRPTLPYPLG